MPGENKMRLPLPARNFIFPAVSLLLLVVASIPGLWRNQYQIEYFFQFEMRSLNSGRLQLFYDSGYGAMEKLSHSISIRSPGKWASYRIPLPIEQLFGFRLDPSDQPGAFDIGAMRVVNRSGAELVKWEPRQLKPVNDIASAQLIDDILHVVTVPSAGDAQLELTGVDVPLPLPADRKWDDIHDQIKLVLRPLLTLSALGLVAFWAFQRWRPWWVSRPRIALIAVGILAAILCCYPVVFFGSSFASPAFGTSLLYPNAPFVPGCDCSVIESGRNSDVGAFAWQNLPYAAIQRKAVENGEFPLWNRYNSLGLPLFGQGQSQFLDPSQIFPILADGNNWGWDIKFILSRALLAIGVGWIVLFATKSLPAAVTSSLSCVFIGYYSYRINHPAVFSLTYAPWILYFWFRFISALTFSRPPAPSSTLTGEKPDRRSLLTGIAGIVVVSFFQLNAGTPKEGTMTFLVVSLCGFVALLCAAMPLRRKLTGIGIVVLLAVITVFIQAPGLLAFLDTLQVASHGYGVPGTGFNPLKYFVGFFEIGFYEQLAEGPIAFPGLNLLAFCGIMAALVSFRRYRLDPFFLSALFGSIFAVGVAYGVIPESIIFEIPFVRNIQHIGNTFTVASVVPCFVLAGYGFDAFFKASHSERKKQISITFLTFFILTALYFVFYALADRHINDWFQLTLTMIAVLMAFLALLARQKPLQRGWGAAIAVCLFLLHMRFGMQPLTPFEDFNYVALNPPERADLHVPSPTIEIAKSRPGPYRIIGEGTILFPGFNAFYGIESLNGPDALYSPFVVELLDGLGLKLWPHWNWLRLVGPEDWNRLAVPLNMLNVGYVVAFNDSPVPEGSVRIARADLDVWRRNNAWPRAFFVDRLGDYQTVDDIAKFLKADGRPFAVVQKQSAPPTPPPADRKVLAAEKYRLDTNGTRFTVNAPHPGYAVLTESYWPDSFYVTLNGQPGEVLRVNHAFRGVYVPAAGLWEIHFFYRPPHWTLSWWLALSGLVLFFALMATAAYRCRCKERASAAHQ
jgi:hypothetical protein